MCLVPGSSDGAALEETIHRHIADGLCYKGAKHAIAATWSSNADSWAALYALFLDAPLEKTKALMRLVPFASLCGTQVFTLGCLSLQATHHISSFSRIFSLQSS